METSLMEQIEGTIEALLFVSEKPLTLEQFKDILETIGTTQIKEAMTNLQKEYAQKNRGMVIAEIAGGYQMLS
ncbi:MAG TPA: SMC-Scp complex subunit ScpB, partial [Candidatus Omnitrophota bacterium]|nr:SMC-Scp complex subunit ScpB [Candidatus Omnitrophota bacterium]